MKSAIMLITSLLLSSNAYSQVKGQPFRLEPGTYDSGCWSVDVSQKDNGDYRRKEGYEKGTFTSIIDGDVAMEIVQAQSLGKAIARVVTKVITTPLENGIFKQTSEIESTNFLGNFSSMARLHYETNMRVTDNHIQNIMVRYGNESERPASGESTWYKRQDGRIVVRTHLRKQRQVTTDTVCEYTPQN